MTAMQNIEGIEKVEQALGRWSPGDLAIIEGLELKNESDSTLIVKALFQPRSNRWPNFDKEMFRISIQFDAVIGLHMKDFGGGAVQIMGFDIHFVGDRGLEGINYEIEDYENGRIQFSCRDIMILSVELAENGDTLR